MKDFRVLIDTENAAFGDDWHEAARETARILRAIADKLEAEPRVIEVYQSCRDINGNQVGSFRLRFNDIEES